MIHRNNLFLFLGMASIALILTSPAIYAAIEPHITITMDPGQTTNPFQIKDDSNNDVFYVDTEGHVTPEHPYRQLEYLDSTIITVDWEKADVTTPSHAGVLAQWGISNPSGNPYHIFHDGGWATAISRMDSGVGGCWGELEWATNEQMDNWGNAGLSWGSSAGTWTASSDSYYHTEWSGFEPTGFRYIEYAGDASTVCSFAEHSLVFPMIIPPHLDLTRIK